MDGRNTPWKASRIQAECKQTPARSWLDACRYLDFSGASVKGFRIIPAMFRSPLSVSQDRLCVWWLRLSRRPAMRITGYALYGWRLNGGWRLRAISRRPVVMTVFGTWDGDGISGKPSVKIKPLEQRAYFYKGGRVGRNFAALDGPRGLNTPIGQFSITPERHRSRLEQVRRLCRCRPTRSSFQRSN